MFACVSFVMYKILHFIPINILRLLELYHEHYKAHCNLVPDFLLFLHLIQFTIHSLVLYVAYAVPEYTVDTAHLRFVQGIPQHGRQNGNQTEVQ
jgi:hypothetical protein